LLSYQKNQICDTCQKNFYKISENHCPLCWKEGTNDICQNCKDWEKLGVSVNHQAIFQYNSAMKEFFSNYKFMGDYHLRHVFAPYFRAQKQNKGFTIVPIPISEKRLQERGFNQITAFLDAAAIPFQNLLAKNDTVKQSSLNREERLAGKNTFKLVEGVIIPQKVLLIDDIYTTGATLQRAVKILKDAGAQEIKSFSLCR
jgi:ComF family protein